MTTALTIVALVHATPTVVYRVIAVCHRYRAQIESVTLTRTERDEVSRMTLVVHGAAVTPLVPQLRKLIDVLEVHTEGETVALPTNQRPSSLPHPESVSTTPLPLHSAQADGDF